MNFLFFRPECQKQIVGFSGARYKKFATLVEAEEFVQENRANKPVIDRRSKSETPASEGETKTKSESEAPEAPVGSCELSHCMEHTFHFFFFSVG